MRVLVTGAGGLLGGRLARLLHERGLEILAIQRDRPAPYGPRTVSLDLLQGTALERVLDEERAQAVVHAAVLGRADQCEADPRLAQAVNADLPGRVARLCRERGLRLVALSTDLVFDGTRAPYRECDATRPLSVYGRTKRDGEQVVLDASANAVVARVTLVSGRGHGSRGTATESIAWSLRKGQAVHLFSDEYRTPVDAESLADAVERLLGSPSTGLFNLGGPERLSRHELGLRVARVLGLDPSPIVAARQADHGGPDSRPPDVSLDSSRARRELGWEPLGLDEAIRRGRLSPA